MNTIPKLQVFGLVSYLCVVFNVKISLFVSVLETDLSGLILSYGDMKVRVILQYAHSHASPQTNTVYQYTSYHWACCPQICVNASLTDVFRCLKRVLNKGN